MSRKRYFILVLVFLVGVAVSCVSFFMLRMQEEKNMSFDFNMRANSRISDIRDGIEDNIDVLGSIASFYASSQSVERQEFKDFTKRITEIHPDIKALIWMPRVLSKDLEAYKLTASNDGYLDFNIKELDASGKLVDMTNRDEYFPIYYVEPFEENRVIFGVDFSTNDIHRKAMDEAVESGSISVTSKIELIRQKGEYGCKVFMPVYRKDIIFFSATSATVNIAEKTKELNAQGYIKKPFEHEELIGTIKKFIG